MRSYHITATMSDSSQSTHCDLFKHSAAATERAAELFPEATSICVLRLSTALLRGSCRTRRAPARFRKGAV